MADLCSATQPILTFALAGLAGLTAWVYRRNAAVEERRLHGDPSHGDDGDDPKSGEDVCGGAVVSGCDAADVLEAIGHPLNGASAYGQAPARSGPSAPRSD